MTISGNARSSYRQSYQQTSKAVGRARCDVVAFARSCGFSEQALADIEVAVGEGLANAYEHACRGEGGFEVFVRREDRALVVEIQDRGPGFDVKRIARPARPSTDALRGFGMFIMRELMDEIEYSECGTRLRLRKRLPHGVDQAIGGSIGRTTAAGVSEA